MDFSENIPWLKSLVLLNHNSCLVSGLIGLTETELPERHLLLLRVHNQDSIKKYPSMPKTFNLTLRTLMEMGVILSFGHWGYQFANRETIKILMGIIVPMLIFGFWGLVNFHHSRRFSEPLGILQELFVTAAAAFLYTLQVEPHFDIGRPSSLYCATFWKML